MDESPQAASAAIPDDMKTSHILAIAAVVVVIVSCARTPQRNVTGEPRAFLKLGALYSLTFIADPRLPGPIVKVRETGSGGWIRVECFTVSDRDGKRMLVRRS